MTTAAAGALLGAATPSGHAWGRGKALRAIIEWGLTSFLPAHFTWHRGSVYMLTAYYGTEFGRWVVTWHCPDSPGYVVYEDTMAFLKDLEEISARNGWTDTGFYYYYGKLVAALDPLAAEFIATLDAEYMTGVPGPVGA